MIKESDLKTVFDFMSKVNKNNNKEAYLTN